MLRAGEISSVELTNYYIDRIERYDGEINAVVVRDFERALLAAAEADAALARGVPPGLLHGLPMTVKEAYDVAGLPTSWGDPAFRDNVATADATIVRRYKSAGAVLMGKTNVPLRLAEYQSFNAIYGQTNNPWNLERSPGGSSGGSAAALAAGLTGLESGTDIGGSIRNPAHCCGVYGHKPTWGLVPQGGYANPAATGNSTRDLDVLGPLARSADDLELALDVVAGAEGADASAWRLELPPARHTALGDFRVAVWPNDDLSPVSSEISDRIQGVADQLARLGATVSDSARPDFSSQTAYNAYLTLLGSVGVEEIPEAPYEAGREAAAAFAPDDHSLAAMLRRSDYIDHRSWAEANDIRNGLRHRWREFFDDWDIVLCPIAALPAPAHSRVSSIERTLTVDGIEVPYLGQVFWAGLATASYLPGTVFPSGPARDGLPIGLQAIGSAYFDRTTIQFARLLAREIGGFEPPSAYA